MAALGNLRIILIQWDFLIGLYVTVSRVNLLEPPIILTSIISILENTSGAMEEEDLEQKTDHRGFYSMRQKSLRCPTGTNTWRMSVWRPLRPDGILKM